MRKLCRSFLAALFVFVLVTGFSRNANAGLGIGNITNAQAKKAFSCLHCYVDSGVVQSNLRNNRAYEVSNLKGFIYDQTVRSAVKVGNTSLAKVGCELIACYNATYALTVNKSKAQLASIISVAESRGYTMAVSKDFFIESIRNKFSASASLGTDAFMLPNILNSQGVVRSCQTFNDFDSMNNAVNKAKANRNFKVYIVSFWNGSTLSESLKKGYHTVCFVTEGQKIYDYNNIGMASGDSYNNRNLRSTLSQLIGGKGRFIVGYEIVKQ